MSTDTQVADPASALAGTVLTAGHFFHQESFEIGERTYQIQELTVEHTLLLVDTIVAEGESLLSAGLLDPALYQDLDQAKIAALMPKILQVWRTAPDFVGRVLALLLGGTQPDDPQYVLRLKLRQVPAVISAFMRANAWQDLAESFFRLRQEISAAIGGGPLADSNSTSSDPPTT